MKRPDAIALKLIRMTIGSCLLVLGLAGLFMPVVPGWLLIIPALALLAKDFAWAEHLHLSVKQRFDRAVGAFEQRRQDPDAERDAA